MNISAATVVNYTFLGEASARRNEADIRKISIESNSFEDLLSNEKSPKKSSVTPRQTGGRASGFTLTIQARPRATE